MKRYIQTFKDFLNEADDPSYYQETFYFTILISMTKDIGGSRDETKNDIRALPEILTVTLVESEKGGVQRDLGSKYLSTLKLHVRLTRGGVKELIMEKLVQIINNLRGVSVLRYKEKKPTPRRKAFQGSYKITEGDYYQSAQHMKDVMDDASELTTKGPQTTGGGSYDTKRTKRGPWRSSPPGAPGGLEETELDEEPTDLAAELDVPVVKDTDLSRLDGLYEDVAITIGGDALKAFGVHNNLNQKVWEGDEKVRPGVKGALLDIVEEFMEGLDLGVEPEDIIMTGSLANYNWSKFSDIDIHILVDFREINDNTAMVKKFVDAIRSNWNKLHTIMVKGHEVELYLQDTQEPHVSSGVYSLLTDRWLIKPTPSSPTLDKETATKKMKSFAREVDKLSAIYDRGRAEDALTFAERLKDKLKRMRQSGLERAGIYSPENLAFKMLRRSGDIEQLFSIYTQAYDKAHSLDQ